MRTNRELAPQPSKPVRLAKVALANLDLVVTTVLSAASLIVGALQAFGMVALSTDQVLGWTSFLISGFILHYYVNQWKSKSNEMQSQEGELVRWMNRVVSSQSGPLGYFARQSWEEIHSISERNELVFQGSERFRAFYIQFLRSTHNVRIIATAYANPSYFWSTSYTVLYKALAEYISKQGEMIRIFYFPSGSESLDSESMSTIQAQVNVGVKAKKVRVDSIGGASPNAPALIAIDRSTGQPFIGWEVAVIDSSASGFSAASGTFNRTIFRITVTQDPKELMRIMKELNESLECAEPLDFRH